MDMRAGSEVVGASINGHGRLTVLRDEVGTNTKLSEIDAVARARSGL